MNKSNTLKYILFVLLAVLLVAMPILSLNAGISGDEEVHMKQAESVIKYYSSFGKDRSALHTPYTNLKYYGQSFDNLTTLLAQIFNVEDVYTFRHICNSLIGWLCILFVALIVIHLSGYKAAIFAVILMVVSPRFMGHTYNNLKDIPFALGYIASLYYTLWVIEKPLNIKLKHSVGLIAAMAFTLSIRAGGLLVHCYFTMFMLMALLKLNKEMRLSTQDWFSAVKSMLLILVSSYFIALLFWPYALENPFTNVIRSMQMMSNYPVTLRQVFEGKVYWSDQLPWYYLFKYVLITIPIVVLPLMLLFAIKWFNNVSLSSFNLSRFVLMFAIIFPFAYTLVAQSNVYGAWRHLLFVYPVMVIVAALAFGQITALKIIVLKYSVIALVILGMLPSAAFSIRNYPHEYAYFNMIAGDYEDIASEYEVDYYYHSVREASLWLKKHLEKEENSTVKIASNYGIYNYFDDSDSEISYQYTPYYKRGNVDWDYGIFYRTTIAPAQTGAKLWPPVGTIKTVNVEEAPVCAIVKRQTFDDLHGKEALEIGDYEKAVSLLENATHIDPGNEIAWINLGKSYLTMSKLKLAKQAFKQCLQIIPNYEPCMYYLAQIEIDLGSVHLAKTYYEEILKQNNKSLNTYLAYAKLEDSLGERINALSLLDEYLKYKPASQEAINMKKKIIDAIN